MAKRRHHVRRHHRRYRHNPVGGGHFSGAKASIGGLFKESLLGVGGIVANNFLSAQLGGMLGSTTIPGLGSPKGLVKIAIPLLVGVTIGKRKPMIRQASAIALSVAILEAIKPLLPAGIPGLSGDARVVLPAFSEDYRPDISGYEASFALPSSIAN